MEYDIDKIRTHLQLGLRHLLNAQKDRDRAGILDVLEVAYVRDCLAVALDECRSTGPEATVKVRGSNNLVSVAGKVPPPSAFGLRLEGRSALRAAAPLAVHVPQFRRVNLVAAFRAGGEEGGTDLLRA